MSRLIAQKDLLVATVAMGRAADQDERMRYMVPVRITVDVHSPGNVVEQAKAELQRKFDVSQDEWEERQGPFIEEHFAHALGLLLCSDAVQGSVRGILETLVKGLEVVGHGVSTNEVVADEEGWARRLSYVEAPDAGHDNGASSAVPG